MPVVVGGVVGRGGADGHVVGECAENEGGELGSEGLEDGLYREVKANTSEDASLARALSAPGTLSGDAAVGFVDDVYNESRRPIVGREDTVRFGPSLVDCIEDSLSVDLTESIDNVETKLGAASVVADACYVDCFLWTVAGEC